MNDDVIERDLIDTPLRITLRGGIELTPAQCQEALDAAMLIIETVGTTGIYTRYQQAYQWMARYYPNWS